MAATESDLLPQVGHVNDDELPWIDAGDGIEMKLMRVVPEQGIWIIRNRFRPGVQVQTHRHTGTVEAFTLSGRWHYAEYKIDYSAGTFLHEPAGSVHTLTVNADNTEPTDVLFVMQGANLNLGADGEITHVDDGPRALEFYLAACAEKGLPKPRVLLS